MVWPSCPGNVPAGNTAWPYTGMCRTGLMQDHRRVIHKLDQDDAAGNRNRLVNGIR